MALSYETAIIDPLVPPEAARSLRNSRDLIPFGARRLPAEPASVRSLLIPVAGMEIAGASVAALAAYRLGALNIAALHLQQVPYFLIIAILVSGLFVMLAGIEGLQAWRDMTAERQSKGQAIRYHRRYVVPDTDMDVDAAATWARVVTAANAIRRSRAARESAVDPVWVTSVLPHHQWDIAQKLARLSWLRNRQRDILAADPDSADGTDADIAQILGAQRRAQQLAMADVEHHVRLLEQLAGRVATLDARLKRERTARDLAALDQQHEELAAMIHHDASWHAADLERASADLQPEAGG